MKSGQLDYKSLLIRENFTLIQAMERLDETACKVLFVVDENGTLLAALTDGDIRRHILKNGSLDSRVSEMANYQPKFVFTEQMDVAKQYMQGKEILVLPVIDEQHRVIGVIRRDGDGYMASHLNRPVPVVINAGGKGTRLYPYTKILPKPLIPIGDIPIAEHIVNRFLKIGCTDFYMIVNHKRNMIKSYFNDTACDYNLTFIDEDTPLGTGGGLSLLKGKLRDTFIFTNCDTIIEDDFDKMLRHHTERENLVTMICALKNYEVPYGVVEAGDGGALEGFREKPRMSFFTNTGCYFVEPRVVEEMRPGESVGFPTIIEGYRQRGEHVGIYPVSEKSWLDMGQFDSMEQMKERLGVE